LEIVRALLAAKAEVNAKTASGITALIVASLCIGAWQKRLQADYYRERADAFYFEASPNPEPPARMKPRRTIPSNYYGPQYSGPDYVAPDSHMPPLKRRRAKSR